MATNLALNDDLIEEAKKLGKHKTKREAVNKALEEYVARKKQMEILDVFGSIVYEPDYDYKIQRKT